MQDTAKETWCRIQQSKNGSSKRCLRGKSLSNKLSLKEELLNLRMEEGSNLMEYLSSFNRCVNDLQRMEVIYSTEDKALFLTSLHPSYKHFQTTLMFEKITLDFEFVVHYIMTLHRMTQRSGESSQGEGLFAKTRERSRSRKHKGKKGNRVRSKSRQKKVVSSVGQRSTGRRIAPHGRKRRTKGRTQRTQLRK